MEIGVAGKNFETKAELIKHFGEKFKWELEKSETVNIEQGIGDYQTADDIGGEAYPEPLTKYRLRIQKETASLEETYYWFLHFMKFDMGFSTFDKIYDIYSASETSAMFGSNAQRLSIQQDKASQYLAQIGQLIKTIFPLVRELRVIDERLEMYRKWKEHKSADISLKHLFIQMVEGGTQNPDSVYGLAQKLGFTILPDLFLNTHVYETKDIDKEIEQGQVSEMNNTVKTVLKRKLYLYINWKHKTEKELQARRNFNLQYMRQHWNVIKLYMNWIRPYLKTARRLERHEGFTESADIISGFDTSKLEIETLAKKPHDLSKNNKLPKAKRIYQCILLTCTYKSQPKMSYNPQFQQQNVAHSGVVDISLRSYTWSHEEIAAFKEMRRAEDIEMLKSLDENVAASFSSLGKEFEDYLREIDDEETLAKDKAKKEKEKATSKKIEAEDKQRTKFRKFGPLEPFLDMGAGVGSLFTDMFSGQQTQGKSKKDQEKKEAQEKETIKALKKSAQGKTMLWAGVTYQVYKKAHRLLAW